MFGFLVGSACLLGLVAVARGHHHRRHFGRHGWRRGKSLGSWFMLRRVLERLDTTPGQEKVIREAVHGLEEDAFALRREARGTRVELAAAVRGPELDKEALDRVFAKHDEMLEKLRASLISATERIHTTLDEQQRSQLADLLESGPCGHRGC